MSFVEKQIKQILASHKIAFEETEHEVVYTSQQAARAIGMATAESGVKSLVLKTKEGEFILVLSPGDKKVDTKKIAQMENTKSLFFARPEEVIKVAGIPIGSVPPFGHKTRLKTYLDEELLKCEYLHFNPGSHTRTITLKASDLLKVLGKTIRF
ncbi:aminoacyl-tRNA deacylase [Chloroflexota bacterium]